MSQVMSHVLYCSSAKYLSNSLIFTLKPLHHGQFSILFPRLICKLDPILHLVISLLQHAIELTRHICNLVLQLIDFDVFVLQLLVDGILQLLDLTIFAFCLGVQVIYFVIQLVDPEVPLLLHWLVLPSHVASDVSRPLLLFCEVSVQFSYFHSQFIFSSNRIVGCLRLHHQSVFQELHLCFQNFYLVFDGEFWFYFFFLLFSLLFPFLWH